MQEWHGEGTRTEQVAQPDSRYTRGMQLAWLIFAAEHDGSLAGDFVGEQLSVFGLQRLPPAPSPQRSPHGQMALGKAIFLCGPTKTTLDGWTFRSTMGGGIPPVKSLGLALPRQQHMGLKIQCI